MSSAGWLMAGVLGGFGAIARFLLDGFVAVRLGRSFPFGTLVVNAIGSFVLGLLVGLALEGEALLIVGTATIGSYTTFSTWMLETQRLFEDGELLRTAGNILISLAVGFGAVLLGHAVGMSI